MYTKIWKPGTDQELDNLFEDLRKKQYEGNDPLWYNYDQSSFYDCTALCITFNDEVPEVCSSITTKPFWPTNTYRILNRLWKSAPRLKMLKKMSPNVGQMVLDQISWLENNLDPKLVFISRQPPGWQKFTINTLQKDFNIEFKTNDYKYQTCTADDESCWQSIIYRGDESLLEQWNKK
jgi:hypothetical protein